MRQSVRSRRKRDTVKLTQTRPTCRRHKEEDRGESFIKSRKVTTSLLSPPPVLCRQTLVRRPGQFKSAPDRAELFAAPLLTSRDIQCSMLTPDPCLVNLWCGDSRFMSHRKKRNVPRVDASPAD